MNKFLSAFSPRGTCRRRCYWGRMLLMTLGFTALLNVYILCLLALGCGGGAETLVIWQALLILVLVLLSVFSLPAGLLVLLPGCSLFGYACPPHFPEPGFLQSLVLGWGALLAFLGMGLLSVHAIGLASRRLRSADCSPWLLAMGLLPGGAILLTGLLSFPAKVGLPAATPPVPRACCPLLAPFCWQGRRGCGSWFLRSLPAALAFVAAFVAGLLFLDDIESYPGYIFILFFLGVFLLSVPALASHPLPVLGLLGFILCVQFTELEPPSLVSILGANDATVAALILFTLLASSLRLCALAAHRLRDAGKSPHNLTALFIPFLLVGVFGNFFLLGNVIPLWLVLFSLWLMLQTRLLLRRSKDVTP